MSLRNLTKKAMLPLNKLVVIILVVLVVATVLMVMFRADISNWMRNLPGYTLPEDDEIGLAFLSFTYSSVSAGKDLFCSYDERRSLGEYGGEGLPEEKEDFRYFRNDELESPRPTVVASDGEMVYYYNFDLGSWNKLNSARDIVFDREIESSCVQIGKILAPERNGVKNRQFIYIDGEKTNLYWEDGEKAEVRVWRKNKLDKLVAEVVDGKVSLISELILELDGKRFFNHVSEKFKEVEKYVGIEELVSLHNSYYGGMNDLCAGEGEEIITGWGEREEISLQVSCNSDDVCVGAKYKYCVLNICESGQIGSLCEDDEDCDKGECVKRQQNNLGFCGYLTHDNCEEFRGDDEDSCYCEDCDCSSYQIIVGQAEEMNDGTSWICNNIFEYIMPQLGFLAPCYYADECESGDMTSNTFNLNYGGEWFSPNRCEVD